MKIIVNGEDLSGSLGNEVKRYAAALSDTRLEKSLRLERPALELRDSRSETEYQALHSKLLRGRDCVDTSDFPMPSSSGLFGYFSFLFRKIMWRLLRYQHDWMSFVQNGINVQLTHHMEMERLARERSFAELDRRIRKLEESAGSSDMGSK